MKRYCSDEEFSSCELVARRILEESGFRPARQFAVNMHKRFRLRSLRIESKQEDIEIFGDEGL